MALQHTVAEFFGHRGASLPWTPTPDGAVVQRLAGLCAVADWIGSNEVNFPYTAGPVSDPDAYWEQACKSADTACRSTGLLRAAPRDVGFAELFPGSLLETLKSSLKPPASKVQRSSSSKPRWGRERPRQRFSLAARFLSNGVADGLTVALPTMATSNAMFGRIEEFVPRLFPSAEVQLALAHGRASREPRFMTLLHCPLRPQDSDAPEASVSCARWLVNRKRILLAQVGVGTVDQALQAALVVRHQFVRMFGLSRNVVIIDEVHAYDAYMEVLLEHLLGWLGALGVPVILLSATLPSDRRAALARAWRGGCAPNAAEAARDAGTESVESARSHPYPLVSVTTREATVTNASAIASSSRTFRVERSARTTSEVAYAGSIAERLLAAARAGGRVVWIRNTVREAQVAFRALAAVAVAGDADHVLFHARFRGCDRTKIERAVLDRFGKDRAAGGTRSHRYPGSGAEPGPRLRRDAHGPGPHRPSPPAGRSPPPPQSATPRQVRHSAPGGARAQR